MLFLAGGVDEAGAAQSAWTTATGTSTGKLWTKTGPHGYAGIFAWGNFGSGGTITVEYLPYKASAETEATAASWQTIATITAAAPNVRGILPNGKYRIRTASVTGSPSLTIALVPI